MNAFQVADASALAVRKMPTQLNIRHEDTSRGGGLPGHPQGAGVGQQGGGDARRPGGSGGWATVSPASPLAPALLAHVISQPLSKRRGEAASDDGFEQGSGSLAGIEQREEEFGDGWHHCRPTG